MKVSLAIHEIAMVLYLLLAMSSARPQERRKSTKVKTLSLDDPIVQEAAKFFVSGRYDIRPPVRIVSAEEMASNSFKIKFLARLREGRPGTPGDGTPGDVQCEIRIKVNHALDVESIFKLTAAHCVA